MVLPFEKNIGGWTMRVSQRPAGDSFDESNFYFIL
jgi:hypothetical protein